MLEAQGIGPGAFVLDLACGKGAVVIELAARLGCRVRAVDACEEFLESGRREAERRGVSHLVEFRAGDVRKVRGWRRKDGEGIDAAIMLNLFGFEESVPLLRRLVKPGGVYVLDDAVGMPRHSPAEWRHSRGVVSGQSPGAPTRNDARRLFCSLGDGIVQEFVIRPSEVARAHAVLLYKLQRNASRVRRRDPELGIEVGEFLSRQFRASELLRSKLRPVVWCVRRGG